MIEHAMYPKQITMSLWLDHENHKLGQEKKVRHCEDIGRHFQIDKADLFEELLCASRTE